MKSLLLTVVLAMSGLCGMAQEQEVDATTGATRQASKTEKLTNALSRLTIGGYGEAVMTPATSTVRVSTATSDLNCMLTTRATDGSTCLTYA